MCASVLQSNKWEYKIALPLITESVGGEGTRCLGFWIQSLVFPYHSAIMSLFAHPHRGADDRGLQEKSRLFN